jgi:hypothetical protein
MLKYLRIRWRFKIVLCVGFVFATACHANAYPDEPEYSIETTLGIEHLGDYGQERSITTQFPHLDLTEPLKKQIGKMLDCQIGELQCLCVMTHIDRSKRYNAVLVDPGTLPGASFRSIPPAVYKIQFHDLLSVSDATSVYALGAFAIKNIKSGKTVILVAEFRLTKTPGSDSGGLLVKGTSRWLEPVVGNWEHSGNFQLDEPRGSRKKDK